MSTTKSSAPSALPQQRDDISASLRRPLQNLHVNKTPKRTTAEGKSQKPKIAEKFVRKMIVLSDHDNLEDSSTMSTSEEPKERLPVGAQCILKPSMFRVDPRPDAEPDLEDLWTLKRGNPVVDCDDEDDFGEYESPSKRQCKQVQWTDRVGHDQSIASILR